jgi:hypothetical protein
MHIILAIIILITPLQAQGEVVDDAWNQIENAWYQYYIPIWEKYIEPYVWEPIVNFYETKKDEVITEINKAIDKIKTNIKDAIRNSLDGLLQRVGL